MVVLESPVTVASGVMVVVVVVSIHSVGGASTNSRRASTVGCCNPSYLFSSLSLLSIAATVAFHGQAKGAMPAEEVLGGGKNEQSCGDPHVVVSWWERSSGNTNGEKSEAKGEDDAHDICIDSARRFVPFLSELSSPWAIGCWPTVPVGLGERSWGWDPRGDGEEG